MKEQYYVDGIGSVQIGEKGTSDSVGFIPNNCNFQDNHGKPSIILLLSLSLSIVVTDFQVSLNDRDHLPPSLKDSLLPSRYLGGKT